MGLILVEMIEVFVVVVVVALPVSEEGDRVVDIVLRE